MEDVTQKTETNYRLKFSHPDKIFLMKDMKIIIDHENDSFVDLTKNAQLQVGVFMVNNPGVFKFFIGEKNYELNVVEIK